MHTLCILLYEELTHNLGVLQTAQSTILSERRPVKCNTLFKEQTCPTGIVRGEPFTYYVPIKKIILIVV